MKHRGEESEEAGKVVRGSLVPVLPTFQPSIRAGALLTLMVFAFLAGPAALTAQEVTNRYTLDDCLRIGLERATAVANARRGEGIAGATVMQARAGALPSVGLNASYTRMDEVQSVTFGDQTVELGALDNYSAKAEATQLLFSGGKVNAAIRAARLSEKYASLGTAVVEADLIRDIRISFYGILMAEAAVGVEEESVAQLESLTEEAERKFKTGTIARFDLLAAKVRLANERPRKVLAVNNLDVAREQFRSLLNLDDRPYALDGELVFQPVEVNLQNLQAAAMTLRPAVLQMEAAAGLKEQDLAAAKSAYWPTLSASLAYGGQNAYGFASSGNELDWHWSAMLQSRWDLWDSGLRRGTVRQKQLELATLRASLAQLKKDVALEVRQSYLTMMHAREAVQGSRENVGLAEEGLRIAKTRYETGASTYLEFTDSNLADKTAKLNMSQALRAHLVAIAQLRHAVGLKEGESLTEIEP